MATRAPSRRASGATTVPGSSLGLGSVGRDRTRASDRCATVAPVRGAPAAHRRVLDGAGAGRILLVEVEGLEERGPLAGGEVAPLAERDALEAERTDANPSQPRDGDTNHLHDPMHDVVHPLVDHDLEDEPFVGFPQDAELPRHHLPPVDRHAVANALQGLLARARKGEDVVLLVEFVTGMHHAVRDVPIVGEQEQPLGVPVEAADWEDALGHVDQIHDRATIPLVAGRRDVAAWLVEEQVARLLGPQELAVDPDLRRPGINFGPQLGDDVAVDGHAPGPDQFLGRPTRAGASGGHDTLQALHQRGLDEDGRW